MGRMRVMVRVMFKGPFFKNRSQFTVLFILTLFSSFEASAYIPPSGYILKTWVGRHSSIKLVRVRQQVTPFKDGKPLDLHFKETLFFGSAFSGFKSYTQDETGHRIESLEKPAAQASPVTMLLLGSDINQVGSVLKAQGIPILLDTDLLALPTEEDRYKAEDQSMSRWKNSPAWVIGTKAQLWFQKDNFQPVRLMVPADAYGQDLEFQFDEMGGSFSYPRLITIAKRKTGEIIFQSRLIDISPVSEGSIPAQFFESHSESIEKKAISEELSTFVKTYYNVLR